MPLIHVVTEDLREMNLSITQYLIMWGLYNDRGIKGLVVVPEAYENLMRRGYIVKNGEYYNLGEEGKKLFEEEIQEEDLFKDFIEAFPTRVSEPSGATRVLSPASIDSLMGAKIKKKWRNITGKNLKLQAKIIDCLKAEVAMRKSTGALYWMRNIETWLNKATWEDYAYLTENQTLDGKVDAHKRIGEISL
jgi:hypothetical protein